MERKGKSCHQGTTSALNGPYKATQLWNDVIQAFRSQMPCGRHRRIMKSFDNCFSGSSATEWLFNYLKSSNNFKTDLSRDKAESLVNKIYKAGIFEEVKVSKSMQHKPEVQGNRLYRFLPVSPSKAKMVRLPLAPRNDAGLNKDQRTKSLVKLDEPEVKHATAHHKSKVKIQNEPEERQSKVKNNIDQETTDNYPPCYLITRILTPSETKQIWEKVFFHRLKKALGVTHHGDIVSPDAVNGNNIMHNCIYLNKNGTVTNIAPQDHFPHWVWSAMKCLARWPEPQETGLPNYPGFEKDVFVVVKDYFLGLEQPLIPFSLYSAITNVFVFAGNHCSQDDKERQSVVDSLWTSASLDNVIMNLAKKYNLLDGVEESYDNEMAIGGNQFCYGDHEDINVADSQESLYKTNFSHFNNEDKENLEMKRNGHVRGILSSLPPSGKTSGTEFSASSAHFGSRFHTLPDRKFGSMPNLKVSKYETAFGPDNLTVTRVYYNNGICTDYRHRDEKEQLDFYFPVETHFDIRSERRRFSQNVNFERVKSVENVNSCNEIKANCHAVNSVTFGRSKSFAGAGFPKFENLGVESKNNLMKSTDDLGPMLMREPRSSYLGFQNHDPPGICASNYNQRLMVNEKTSSTVLHDQRYVSHRVSSMDLLSQSYKHLSPVAQSQTLPQSHGSPFVSCHALDTSQTRKSNTSRLMQSSIDLRTRDKSPVDLVKSSSYVDVYSPLYCESYGPGYRPVLDASKERRSEVRTNFNSSGQPPSRNAPVIKHPGMKLTTSTPLSSFHPRKKDLHGENRRSAINLSDVTPLYGSNNRHSYQTQERDYLAYPQTRLSEDRAKIYLRLITLLMPPAYRRKLHILLRLMTKMIANPNLCLDPTQSTRSLLIGTFYPAIVHPEEEQDLDEFLILQLVSFMLDSYDDIFTPPEDLKKQANHHLKQMQRPQVSYSPRPSTSMYFCQQTSVAEYEQKKKAASQGAIEELLEDIIKDQRMEPKVKRQRLKQFQKTYPAIYTHRFPDAESEARVLPPKPKIRDALIGKPLNKLKGLRL